MSIDVSIVLPAYNEAENLNRLINRIVQTMSKENYSYNILLVDDGSSDGTARLGQQLAKYLSVTLVKHPKNLGLGAAMQTGLREGIKSGGIVVAMDADDSHDPALIPQMIKRIEQGDDLVVASRFQPNSEVRGVPLTRQWLSIACSTILRCLFPFKNIRDYSCGYRAYSPRILRNLESRFGTRFVTESSFACMLELLLKLRALGAKGSEVPMVLRYDRKQGVSKMRVFRTVARYGVVMFNGATLAIQSN